MARWLPAVLARVRQLAMEQRVRFTLKALHELEVLRFDADDAVDVLRHLTPGDSAGRLISAQTGEHLYVFRPSVAGLTLYLKLLVRSDCVVISFHEDAGHDS